MCFPAWPWNRDWAAPGGRSKGRNRRSVQAKDEDQRENAQGRSGGSTPRHRKTARNQPSRNSSLMGSEFNGGVVMRAILKSLLYPSRSFATKAWAAMLVVLTICLCTAVANAQTAPLQAVNVSQVKWLNPVLAGGVDSGGAPAGQNIAVNTSAGEIFVGTNSQFEMFNEQTGVVTNLTGTNGGGWAASRGLQLTPRTTSTSQTHTAPVSSRFLTSGTELMRYWTPVQRLLAPILEPTHRWTRRPAICPI